MAHHSSDPNGSDELRKAMAHLLGEFPDGKLNAQDEGALAVGIGHQDGRVVITFPKSVTWIGFTPDQAIDIAQSLIDHARQCGSKKPLSLRVG